jgi:hypothetical protein
MGRLGLNRIELLLIRGKSLKKNGEIIIYNHQWKLFFFIKFCHCTNNHQPRSDETYPDSKAEISTKLVAPKLGLFFNFTGHTFTV